MKWFVLLLSICFARAMPHLSSVPHDHDFLDMVAEIALRVKFDGNSEKVDSFPPAQILSCVPQSQRDAMHTVCEEIIMKEEQPSPFKPLMVAECIMVNLAKALNNETKLLDAKAISKIIDEPSNTLSADQKVAASTSLETCIESDFKVPLPPHLAKDMAEGKFADYVPKYEHRNCPMRAMVCLVKALIDNGCSSIKIEKRSTLIAPVNVDLSDSSSGEQSIRDDTDDSGTHEVFA